MASMLQFQDYYKISFVKKREALLNALIGLCEYNLEWIPNNSPYSPRGTKNVNYNPSIRFYKLNKDNEGDFVLSEPQEFNGYNFDSEWNTRDILLPELILELEKGTEEECIKSFWDTCEILIKKKIHFAVFYAEGMRTPHIHIYDLFPNVKDFAEKNLLASMWCMKNLPSHCFKMLDQALFEEHTIALEFSSHYKTGNMNKLMLEHTPEGCDSWFIEEVKE